MQKIDSIHIVGLCGMLKIPRAPVWLGVLFAKLKSKAQMPSAGEEIGSHRLYGASLKSDTNSREMSAMIYTPYTPDFMVCHVAAVAEWYSYISLVTHLVRWLATLTVVPLGLGSNPGKAMDAYKCIMPSWHYTFTLNNRQTTSPLVKLVEGEERWYAPDHAQGSLPQNWVETEARLSSLKERRKEDILESGEIAAEGKYVLDVSQAFGPLETPSHPPRVAFSHRTNSPSLIEDGTLNDSGIISSLIDYVDGQEEPNSLRPDKIYAKMQLSN
ncbi:uncharacterized protein TNCV_2602741 [Trichonephila clavipes]|nr:uncharacterized protein TNCV_2602741 [Trichonephila clavipes]